MGTPDFAVPAFNKLIETKNHEIVSVFTSSPKPKGRGLANCYSPIHQLGLKNNIPVFTPRTLKTKEIQETINSIEADIIVVVAYGFLIPPAILAAKKYGCLNIHPSLLPKYRGAAPLQRTIINGETQTAVAIMQMDEGLDTGDIIVQEIFAVPPRITLPLLHDKCAKKGADLLIKALDNIDILPGIPQSLDGDTYAHKLSKEEGKINWQESAWQIDCRVRGMNPWPGVYFYYQNKLVKILETDYQDAVHNHPVGTVISNKLHIACGEGVLHIKRLQPAGKKSMTAEEFLSGYPVLIGTIIEN